MKKIIFLILVLLNSSVLFASLQRVIINYENQSDTNLEYKVTFDKVGLEKENIFRVRVSLPEEQLALSKLWKIYLWSAETDLSIPIDYRSSKGQKNLEVIFTADSKLIQKSAIAIRCGEHAPLAEFIYQIDLGSFFQAHNKALNVDATSVAPIS